MEHKTFKKHPESPEEYVCEKLSEIEKHLKALVRLNAKVYANKCDLQSIERIGIENKDWLEKVLNWAYEKED